MGFASAATRLEAKYSENSSNVPLFQLGIVRLLRLLVSIARHSSHVSATIRFRAMEIEDLNLLGKTRAQLVGSRSQLLMAGLRGGRFVDTICSSARNSTKDLRATPHFRNGNHWTRDGKPCLTTKN